MSTTLIDSVKTVFTDVLVSKCAGLLGENESNTRKALQAAIPMALTSILHKAGYQESAVSVYNLSKQAAGNDFFGHVHELSVSSGGLAAGSALLNKGGDYTNSLFGAASDSVIKEISRHSGVSLASASFLTGISTFACLDIIGRHIASENLDVKGMGDWLATQRNSIINSIPTGLQVKHALGITHYPGEKAGASGRNTTLYVIIALIIILAAAFFAYRYYYKPHNGEPVNTTDTTQGVRADTTVAPAR